MFFDVSEPVTVEELEGQDDEEGPNGVPDPDDELV